MRNYFVFDGLDSRDYGVYVFGADVLGAHGRQFEYITIPGRDGELIGKEKRLSNVRLSYPIVMYEDVTDNLAVLRSKLISVKGYAQLTDSINVGEFRMAVFDDEFRARSTEDNGMAKATITFNCKPQRFLWSGTTPIVDETSITNPTSFESKPLIRVYGFGELAIGDQIIDIEDAFEYVDIDCEMMECYYGTQNANLQVSFEGNDFPVIPVGTSSIAHDNTITSVEITPRWWRV